MVVVRTSYDQSKACMTFSMCLFSIASEIWQLIGRTSRLKFSQAVFPWQLSYLVVAIWWAFVGTEHRLVACRRTR